MIGIVKDNWVDTDTRSQEGLQRYPPYDRVKMNLNVSKNVIESKRKEEMS